MSRHSKVIAKTETQTDRQYENITLPVYTAGNNKNLPSLDDKCMRLSAKQWLVLC